MKLAEWKEYAASWCLAVLSDHERAAKIRRARTWAELETAIPWKLVAALANRCRVTDL